VVAAVAPMNPREEVLARIRRALADRPAVPTVPRAYVRAGPARTGEPRLADLFVARVADYSATVTRCAAADAADTLRTVLARHRVQRLVIPDGFPADWVARSCGVLGVDAVRDDPVLTTADLDAVGAVVTSCAVAIAETGMVVLDGRAGMGRRALSLVPDLHVVVVRAEQVVAGVPDALRVLDPLRPLTWVSGPSATSDIELDRVEGVHGPRRLEVVVCE
jgi:L-lactate dehydrogenase complex protein LldG